MTASVAASSALGYGDACDELTREVVATMHRAVARLSEFADERSVALPSVAQHLRLLGQQVAETVLGGLLTWPSVV